jgi:hypothetical protein
VKKNLVIATIVTFCFIGIISTFLITTTQSQTKATQKDADEPTVVKKGQISDKEREYSKEYKNLYADRNGPKLTDLSESSKKKGNKKEIGVSIGVPTIPTIGSFSPINASEFLKNLSCNADAVVIGVVNKKYSHLTEDETFIYTEHEFLIKEILKNNKDSNIEVNNDIQITRPGGLIKLDNQIIRAEDKSYAQLQTGKTYLLFLKFVSKANGYMVSNVNGDFVLENNTIKSLSKLSIPEGLKFNEDSEDLINLIKASVSANCGESLNGGN